MNTQGFIVFWLVCLLTPVSVLIFYPVTIYSCLLCLGLVSSIFLLGVRSLRAYISKEIAQNLLLKVNAMNHNINEALVSAVDKNEPVSLADSLSIKENLYAIDSTVSIARSNISTHHRKLKPLLSVTLHDYYQLAKALGVNLQISFEADQKIRVIKVDPSVLNKVLSIVLSNAISVTPKGRKVMVSTELCENYYSIVVSDFSGGICPEVIDKTRNPKIHSLGRRVDVHHRIHYGLGFISLNKLTANSNINIETNFQGITNNVVIKVSRQINSIGSVQLLADQKSSA